MKTDQLLSLLTGIVIISGGILIILKPIYYSLQYHRYMDFTEIRIPFGMGWIIMGVLCIYFGFRKPPKQ